MAKRQKTTGSETPIPIFRAWRQAISDARFMIMVVITAICGFIIVPIKSTFLRETELREGVILADPVLELLGPHDVTWFIFGLLYSAILLGGYELLRRPYRFLIGAQAYFLIMVVRILTLWLVPLDPPTTTIPLVDPVVDFFVKSDTVLTRDLFFSGHTYTSFLVFLLVIKPWRKILLGLACASIGILVVVQHVHYAIDVVAALFIAFGCVHFIRHINKSFCPEPDNQTAC